MRVLFVVLSFLAANLAVAAEPTEARCDSSIARAIKTSYTEGGWKLLNSKTVKECLRLFPKLDEKHFPSTPTSQPGSLPDTATNPDPISPVDLNKPAKDSGRDSALSIRPK